MSNILNTYFLPHLHLPRQTIPRGEEKRTNFTLPLHPTPTNHTLVTLSTCVKAVLLLSRLREVLRRGVKLPKWIQIDQIEPTDDKDIKCVRLFKKSLWGLSLIIIKILST